MPVSTSCVKCHRRIRAKSKFAGKRVHCPRCGWDVALPRESGAEDAGSGPSTKSRGPSRPRRTDDDPDERAVPMLRRSTSFSGSRRSSPFGQAQSPVARLLKRWWWALTAALLLLCWLASQIVKRAPNQQIVVQQGPRHIAPLRRPRVDQRFGIPDAARPNPAATAPQDDSADNPTASAPPPNESAPGVATPHSAPRLPSPAGPPAADETNPLPVSPAPGVQTPNATSPDTSVPSPRASSRHRLSQHAARFDTHLPHVGPYSEAEPPPIDDIVFLPKRFPRTIGKVATVDGTTGQCKIKIIEASAYESTGKIRETGKTLTVPLDQLWEHPRLQVQQMRDRNGPQH